MSSQQLRAMLARLMLYTYVKYQVVLYNSVLIFSHYYCIVSNDYCYNGIRLIFTEDISSSPRWRKMLCPLEEHKYNIYICIGTGGLQLLWDIATVMTEEAPVKCITYLLVCWKFQIMEAMVACLRLGWTLSLDSFINLFHQSLSVVDHGLSHGLWWWFLFHQWQQLLLCFEQYHAFLLLSPYLCFSLVLV